MQQIIIIVLSAAGLLSDCPTLSFMGVGFNDPGSAHPPLYKVLHTCLYLNNSGGGA